MRFFRGIAVPASTADAVINSILQNGLNRDKGWLMLWEKPKNPDDLFEKPDLSMGDTRGPRETAPVGICFCGEEASAAVYACERNIHSDDDTPILIEIEADPETVAIDGRDFLYTIFQLGDPRKAAPAIERLFGPKILRFAEAAWSSTDQSRRIALCDLAIHNRQIVANHYENRLAIGGRHSTRFHNAFKIKLPIASTAVIRVWRPDFSHQVPAVDVDFTDLLLPPERR